jgi:site-specific recombinase XerD
LRVSELVTLQWAQIDLAAARIHVRRLKRGEEGTHPIAGDELRLLRAVKREALPDARFVLMTERSAPMTRAGFARMLERVAGAAGLGELSVHPHMLRHGAGFKLINDGHDLRLTQQWLGHRSISNTVRYTKLSDRAFEAVRWRTG